MYNLEQIFSQNPQSPVFTVLASLYYQRRSYKNAAKVCQIGLKHDPNNIAGQYILAKLLLLKNELLIAEKILKKIISTEPQHLNALLLLLAVMEKLNKNCKTLSPNIKYAIRLYPLHITLKAYYAKYCIVKSSKTKTSKSKKTNQKSDFILNSKLATKTLYHLFYSQQKYMDAYNVLLVMKKNKKNTAFVSQEMKKIKNKLL